MSLRSQMRLTDKLARDLVCPTGVTEKTFFDADLPGFGLRVLPSGSRSWLAQYAVNGKTKKVTLGKAAIVTAGEARKRARKILASAHLAKSPAASLFSGEYMPVPLEFKRVLLLPEVAELLGVSIETLKGNHPDKLIQLSRRRCGMRVRDILALGGNLAATIAASEEFVTGKRAVT